MERSSNYQRMGENTQFSTRVLTIEHILINIKLFLALLRFNSKEKIEFFWAEFLWIMG